MSVDPVKDRNDWERFTVAWTPLLRAYLQRLHCGNEVLHDLIYDVLAEAYVASSSRTTLEEEKVLRVTAREVSRAWKRSARERCRCDSMTALRELAARTEAPGHREQLWAWLHGLLTQLPERQRLTIEMQMDDIPDALIAKAARTTSGAVRVLRYRGIRAMRRLAMSSPPPRQTRSRDRWSMCPWAAP